MINIIKDIYQKLKESNISKNQIHHIYNTFELYNSKKEIYTIEQLNNIFIEWILYYNNFFFEIEVKYPLKSFSNIYEIINLLIKHENKTQQIWTINSDYISKQSIDELMQLINNQLDENATVKYSIKVELLQFIVELKKLIPELNDELYWILIYIQKQLKIINEYIIKICHNYVRIFELPTDLNNKINICICERNLYSKILLKPPFT